MPTDERERFWEIINNIRDVDTPLVCMQTQLEELQSAWEKQIPKTAERHKDTTYFKCPVCGSFDIDDYCQKCGQAIRYGDGDDS